jgi:hypothetical protein
VPVYRVSPERWQKEQDEELAEFVRHPDPPNPELPQKWLERWTQHLLDLHGGYPYNQIIGWIQVRWVGPFGHIKFYYYRVSTSRIGRYFRQGRYVERGKITDFRVGYYDTSAAMLGKIREELVRKTQSGGSLKGRHLDLELFDVLAPAVEIRKILQLDPPRPTLRTFAIEASGDD